MICDVVLMSASHLLLGRPWQFDREAVHDGSAKTYYVSKSRKHVLLTPLSPSQAMKDQLEISKVAKESLFANKGKVKYALYTSELIYLLVAKEFLGE